MRNLIERLKLIDIDLDKIPDRSTHQMTSLLLGTAEGLAEENESLHTENQQLRDENNRLKGEQGKPKIRPQKKDGDISSEKERKTAKLQKKKKRKKQQLKIHATKKCTLDSSSLPPDAVFKGYEGVIVQDISIKPKNTKFKVAIYYSASENKSYRGKPPSGYHGSFGPGLKALILSLYNDSQMTEPKIKTFLKTFDVDISPASISRIVTGATAIFGAEKEDIFAAGLASTNYQHIDDTSGRCNGKNQYVHVLCNPFYTAYFTRTHKNRQSIIEILSGGDMRYDFDAQALCLMEFLGLSQKQYARMTELDYQSFSEKSGIESMLMTILPNSNKHQTTRRIILEACALSAYQKRSDAVSTLVCDDAPQFKNITDELALCWVHEGRHYKKITPYIKTNMRRLELVLTQLWDYYHKLIAFKNMPDSLTADNLRDEFETIFTQRTGYEPLDARIKKTYSKRQQLLLVLKYPHIPLHNNSAELGARSQARKRDISLQTRNLLGTQAKDIMMTIVQTAKKLEVNVFDYLHDRISMKNAMTSLAQMIQERSSVSAPVQWNTS
jgi:hypothetical protein